MPPKAGFRRGQSFLARYGQVGMSGTLIQVNLAGLLIEQRCLRDVLLSSYMLHMCVDLCLRVSLQAQFLHERFAS